MICWQQQTIKRRPSCCLRRLVLAGRNSAAVFVQSYLQNPLVSKVRRQERWQAVLLNCLLSPGAYNSYLWLQRDAGRRTPTCCASNRARKRLPLTLLKSMARSRPIPESPTPETRFVRRTKPRTPSRPNQRPRPRGQDLLRPSRSARSTSHAVARQKAMTPVRDQWMSAGMMVRCTMAMAVEAATTATVAEEEAITATSTEITVTGQVAAAPTAVADTEVAVVAGRREIVTMATSSGRRRPRPQPPRKDDESFSSASTVRRWRIRAAGIRDAPEGDWPASARETWR